MSFINVTKGNPDLVDIVSFRNNYDAVKIFENGHSLIVFTSDKNTDHASISNKYRKVKETEIDYAIKKIMRTRPENITRELGNGGIIHIYRHKNKQTLH